MSAFVDTNIFVRLLTQDDAEKAIRSFDLLQQANRGEIDLATSEAVIAETVFVLASPRLYGAPRDVIAARLGTVLAGSRIRLEQLDVVLEALRLYANSQLHFVDCLCVAHARREPAPPTIYSYDRGFDRIPGIRHLEP